MKKEKRQKYTEREMEIDELNNRISGLGKTRDFLQGIIVGVAGGNYSHQMYLVDYLEEVKLSIYLLERLRIGKLNNGNDGIPPKPKDLGILPTII